MDKIFIERFFLINGYNVEKAIKHFKTILKLRNREDMPLWDTSGPSKPKTIDEILSYRKKYKKLNDIWVSSDKSDYDFCWSDTPKNKRLTREDITIPNDYNLSECFGIVQDSIEKEEYFIGWIHDWNYNFWQNIGIQTYERENIDHSHLKKYPSPVSPDAPFEINTLFNPGHQYFRPDYVEAVASHMAISRTFCETTGADFDALQTNDWLKVENLNEQVKWLVAWPEPFNSPEGEQKERQEKLRKLLYPKTWNEPRYPWQPRE
jgi:hypothetical protein